MYYTWETARTNTAQAFQRRHVLYLRNGTHKHRTGLSEETCTILEKRHAQTQHKPFLQKHVLSPHHVNPNWLENQHKISHERIPNAHPGCTSLLCLRPAFESDDQKGPLSSFSGTFSAELFLMRYWLWEAGEVSWLTVGLFLYNTIFSSLTPSVPQPVKFLGWKMHAHACKQYIVRSYDASTFNEFWRKSFHMPVCKRRQKCQFQISQF